MLSNYAEDLTPCAPAGHPGVDMWNGLINAQALPIKVPPNLVKAHMLYESGGNQNAFHDEGDGTAGCGLMQITYGTFLVGQIWYYKGGATGGYPEPIFPPTLNVHVGIMRLHPVQHRGIRDEPRRLHCGLQRRDSGGHGGAGGGQGPHDRDVRSALHPARSGRLHLVLPAGQSRRQGHERAREPE